MDKDRIQVHRFAERTILLPELYIRGLLIANRHSLSLARKKKKEWATGTEKKGEPTPQANKESLSERAASHQTKDPRSHLRVTGAQPISLSRYEPRPRRIAQRYRRMSTLCSPTGDTPQRTPAAYVPLAPYLDLGHVSRLYCGIHRGPPTTQTCTESNQ